MTEHPRLIGATVAFDRDELSTYPLGREAFLEMIARELAAAVGAPGLVYNCIPQPDQRSWVMRAKVGG